MNKESFIDWLAAGRVANLPSVVSNVVTGVLLGGFIWSSSKWDFTVLAVTALGCLVGCFLYLGGCFLNDWWDRDWDRENKPSRAVPSGRLPATALLFSALIFLVLGLVFASGLGSLSFGVAVLIVIFILVYSAIHKATSWGVMAMGLCRGALYFLGGSSVGPEGGLFSEFEGGWPQNIDVFREFGLVLVLPALGLVSYIMGLSLLARFEAKGNLPAINRTLACLFLFSPALTHLLFVASEFQLVFVLAALPFLLVVYLATKLITKSLPKGVSLLLAALPLLDFMLVFPLICVGGVWGIPEGFGALFFQGKIYGGAMVALFPLLAFLSALVLQKIAPAT